MTYAAGLIARKPDDGAAVWFHYQQAIEKIRDKIGKFDLVTVTDLYAAIGYIEKMLASS